MLGQSVGGVRKQEGGKTQGLRVGAMQSSAQTGGVLAKGEGAAGRLLHCFSIIEEELARVKALIELDLRDCGEPVRSLVACVNAGQGKMIRPGLVLLSGVACGGATEKHIRAAAIFEMIHSATLLHDDVVDEGESRRGVPTINSVHGNESAVLLGDYLLGRVIRMCVGFQERVAEIIASAAIRTCEGELRQISQRGNLSLGEPGYIEIIAGKTAALFEGACEAGAVLAGAGESTVGALASYGRNVGIAFQITDDLLDLVGEQDKTGKPVGSDLDHSKLTLPLIHFLKTAGEADKQKVKQILSHKTGDAERMELLEKLNSCKSIEYAKRRAEEFVGEAISVVAGIGDNKGSKSLVETARFIVGRTV
jgi:octaprenyl-diphosphate synthase